MLPQIAAWQHTCCTSLHPKNPDRKPASTLPRLASRKSEMQHVASVSFLCSQQWLDTGLLICPRRSSSRVLLTQAITERPSSLTSWCHTPTPVQPTEQQPTGILRFLTAVGLSGSSSAIHALYLLTCTAMPGQHICACNPAILSLDSTPLVDYL